LSLAKELIQENVDVKNRTRTNIFQWRGQFTPQLITYLLGNFASEKDIIVDPFSGSGTVLLESALKDLSCFGFEISPAAYAMSQFFSFANFKDTVRKEIFSGTEEKIIRLINDNDLLPFSTDENNLSLEKQNRFSDFTKLLVANLESKEEKIIALNTLFHCAKSKNRNFLEVLQVSLTNIKNELLRLPYTEKKISCFLADARLAHLKCPAKANLIITSPPYINVFNYHQNYRTIVEAAGWNVLKVAPSEFGSNRKHRGNRFKTVIQYCLDMEEAFYSFWHLLQSAGTLIIIIGKESNVLKVPFYNGQIVRDIIQEAKGYKEIGMYQRSFLNKFGSNIEEEIIVLQKTSQPPNLNVASAVANKHLRFALRAANEEIKQQIQAAINDLDFVKPSPIFHYEENVF